MESMTREEVEIEFHPDNMNTEEASSLRKSWKPLLQSQKERQKVL